jgi:F0F1-type ATP synthase delta subunit
MCAPAAFPLFKAASQSMTIGTAGAFSTKNKSEIKEVFSCCAHSSVTLSVKIYTGVLGVVIISAQPLIDYQYEIHARSDR